MRSSSPFDSSLSSLSSPITFVHRSVSRTYSTKRIIMHIEKRKAQAALTDSDVEKSDNDDVPLGQEVVQKKRVNPRSRRSDTKYRSNVERLTGRQEKGSEVQEHVIDDTRPVRRRHKLANDHPSAVALNRPQRQSLSPSSPKNASEALTPALIFDPSNSPPQPQRTHRSPTTPTKHSHQGGQPSTPHLTPKDLSTHFIAVSPHKMAAAVSGHSPGEQNSEVGSGSRGMRVGGIRRMLTKTQSLGGVLDSPSKSQSTPSVTRQDEEEWSILPDRACPTTPTRSIARTRSLPETPGKEGSIVRGSPIMTIADAEIQILRVKANRTYGNNRTILAESSKMAMERDDARFNIDKISINGPSTKESYADLSRKYLIDDAELGNERAGSFNLAQVFRPLHRIAIPDCS